jgi:hypothetical protein
MRMFSTFLYFALTAVWAAEGRTQGAATLWDHNGPQVSLYAQGPRRQFYYQAPVTDLLEFGVQSGTRVHVKGAPPPYDGEYDIFSQQRRACFGIDQNISNGITMCDAALLFSRLSADDRSKLVQRRADLVQQREQLTGQKPIGTSSRSLDSKSVALILAALVVGITICVAIGYIVFLQPNPDSNVPDLPPNDAVVETPPDETSSTALPLSPSSKAENASAVTSVGLPARYIPNEPPS